LQTLSISYGTFTSADVTACSKLTSLKLYMCEEVQTVNVTGLSDMTSLDLTGCSELETVSGVENLPELDRLLIQSTKVQSLDLRNNTKLTYVDLSSNELHTLKVTGLANMTTLRCPRNVLTEINLTGCTALDQLWCGSNSWSSGNPLDLTQIPNVTEVSIDSNYNSTLNSTDNPITSITIPVGSKLDYLNVNGNALTSLDLTNAEKLVDLKCSDNPLTSLTLDNPELDSIEFTRVYADPDVTKAFKLDTSKSPKLTYIQAFGNYMINEVDFTNNPLLEQLDLANTGIETIDLTHNTKLWELDLDGTDITSLDLTHNTELVYLNISDVYVTNINLSNNTKLKTLNIGGSALTTLSLNNMSSLQKLYANYSYGPEENNVLNSIDFTGCTGLKYVELESIENLHAIDLTDCVALEYLELDLASVLMCKLAPNNTDVEIYERMNTVYLNNVGESFDLKTLVPDIDVNKISNIYGSEDDSTVTVNGTVFSGYQKYEDIRYTYDCGNGKSINPEITIWSLAQFNNSWTTELSMEDWTYGETAKNPSAVAKYGTVVYSYSTSENGTYTSTKPSEAGTYWVKATVEENNSYTGLEAKTSFTINKATPTYTVPTNLEALALQRLSDVDLPDGFTWETPNAVIDSCGFKTFEATYTPDDTENYKVVNNIEISVYVDKNQNSWIDLPFIASWTYGETASEPDMGEAKYGVVKVMYSLSAEDNWSATVPTEAGVYNAKFYVESDGLTYYGTNNHYCAFHINPATPTYTVPDNLTGNVNQTLAEISLPSGFSWMHANQVLNAEGEQVFKAKYTPTDTNNYVTVENIDITVDVSLNGNMWTTYPSIADWTYGETSSQPQGEAKEGTINYYYSDSENGVYVTEQPTNAGTYWMKAVVEESNAYEGLSAKISFEIEKATPSYNVPTGLAALVGADLSTVILSDGFAWENADENVGGVGTKTFKATYTPADTNNYVVVEDIDITVVVGKNGNEWTSEIEMDDFVYGNTKTPSAEAKYGTPKFVYSNEENGEYSENAPVNAGTYYVKAIVEEGEEYAGLESEAVEYTIQKATPNVELPEDLTAKEGDTLADVTLPDGFAWIDETITLNEAGKKTFTAMYIPADANYSQVEVTLTVTVNAVANTEPEVTPDTGDVSNSVIWVLTVISMATLIVVLNKRKSVNV